MQPELVSCKHWSSEVTRAHEDVSHAANGMSVARGMLPVRFSGMRSNQKFDGRSNKIEHDQNCVRCTHSR
jgi:hypothetical protein